MKELIDKTALVEEIKRMRDKAFPNSDWNHGYVKACESIISLLDTLEAKEVDLEKEYEDFVVDDPILGNFITNDTMGMILAKHFFELGLKFKSKKE